MKLVVFFTRGMSLAGWQAAGILERELALFTSLQAAGVSRIAFVTYGDSSETEWQRRLPGIEVLPNRWGLAANLYSLLSPWLHRRSLRGAAVFRTNQINGSWSALIAKWIFRRALVVRCGFLWSDGVARAGAPWWRRSTAKVIERIVMRAADRVIVAGDADAATATQRHGLSAGAVSVIPNFVDTAAFNPMPEIPRERGRVVFVGRLEAEKNVGSLIDAVAGVPGATLAIAGDGSLRAQLEARALERGVGVEFLGRVGHASLPQMLNRAELFVMPSLYEGNPKALMEAMACGVPVLGADVPGIRDAVSHGSTGWLCEPSPAGLRDAIAHLLSDAPLRARLAIGGIAHVRGRCSLSAVAAAEHAVIASLA